MSENAAADTSAAGASSPALPPTNRDLVPDAGQQTKPRRGGGSGVLRNLGLVIAVVLIGVAGVATAGERFLSANNITTILALAATIGILSIGMTFVITGGGIDLSVGSVMGLATVWATTLATQAMARDTHWLVIVVTALAVGTAAGLINGVIVAYGRVVSFIATLAMLVGARGLAEIISGRQTQLIPHRDLRDGQSVAGFKDFFGADILGLPMTVWMFALIAALGWVLLNRTTFGRRTIAVGGNPEAARLAGIKVQRHTMYLFALSGLAAGIAAVTMLARTGVGTSTHGSLFELDAIAAVVVGGTLLIGGRGTIVGTVLGVLIFAMLRNIFILNNLSTSVQAVAQGTIIVLAVLLQQRFAARGSS
ncbi:ABC transporter permease [Georgenia satyanarayanai]|uniref:ABC transporter permease n=1 Tax=Georgenia satyanarayanai TaxID=860221 RepID=UPI002040B23B|nr:ABC transporter permease [Georgenia satyanarayanai]MCM3661078.1 ABC transporter permease [Georgenia satyanarayanai]